MNLLIDFCMSFSICNTWPQYTICSDCLALGFSCNYPADSSFFLTSKTSVNRQSNLIVLHFLTIMGGLGNIGLLSVNLSVVDTMDASIIYINCSLSLYLPANVYISFMFYRYTCSYITHLINDLSIQIVTICCFSQSDWNYPLMLTLFCSKDLISMIKSIT